jgi:hypothetical protein
MSDAQTGELLKSNVRPLLGEIGISLPAAEDIEIRPMIGIGYALVNTSSSGSGNPAASDDHMSATVSVDASAFDVVPGIKISAVADGVEIFTLPKYHIIKDRSFFALEAGAGLRF